MRIRYLLIGIVLGLFLLLGEYLYLNQTRSTRQLVVNYSDAHSVNLHREIDGEDYVMSRNISNGSTVDLERMAEGYSIHYAGNDGFADGQRQISLDDDVIDIKPALSDKVLADKYVTEKDAILAALYKEYPDAKELYKLTSDRLYEQADWFGAVLDYNSDARFNRDNLGLVMHKTDGSWTVVTKPPMPSLNKYAYPDTPIYILEAINKQLFS